MDRTDGDDVEQMLIAAGLFGGLALFGYAAARWGTDSTDRVDAGEWERRRHWRVGFFARRAAGADLLALYAAPVTALERQMPRRPGNSTPLRDGDVAA